MSKWDRRHPERVTVEAFVKNCLKKSKENELIFHEVFSAYKHYMAENMGEKTMLHHLTFGKMFHEFANVPRKLMWREGKCQSVIVGYTFR